MPDSQPYSVPPDDAQLLLDCLNGIIEPKSLESSTLSRLLGQALAVADSVSDNCRDWFETTAICYADVHPHDVDQLNVPSFKGALKGAAYIPAVETSGCCHSCAYRPGSIANQSDIVTEDVPDCLHDQTPFYCHAPEVEGRKTPCLGHSRALATLKRQARTGSEPRDD